MSHLPLTVGTATASHKMPTLQHFQTLSMQALVTSMSHCQRFSGAFAAISVLADVRFETINIPGEIDSWVVPAPITMEKTNLQK